MDKSYEALICILTEHGLKPQLQQLDNEASRALKRSPTRQYIDFQVVPPHVHRRNTAECAIQTFNNHFITGLCSVDPLIPTKLWDKLLHQAITTINLLRHSMIDPCMSAHAQFEGHYNFNHAAMARAGMRVIAHQKPKQLATWDDHGLDGWYIGAAP
jgi:hypothetical protein